MIKYDMSNDMVFKKVLEDKEILSYFLKVITGKYFSPKELKLLPPEIITTPYDKKSVLDVRCSSNDYEINLEMQNRKVSYNMIDRLIYYADKMNVTSTLKGEGYVSKKIISICFINFEDDKCLETIEKYQYRNSGKRCIELDNKQIYLIDIRKTEEVKEKRLRNLIEIMTTKDIEKYLKEEGIMEKIAKAIYYAGMDPVEAYHMMQREKAENDYNIEMELREAKGIVKGKAEAESRIVKRLISNGLSLTEIEALTGIKVGMIED